MFLLELWLMTNPAKGVNPCLVLHSTWQAVLGDTPSVSDPAAGISLICGIFLIFIIRSIA